MYIEFMATLDDMVDTSYRFVERGKPKSRAWINAVFPVATLLFLVAVLLALYPLRDWPNVVGRMWPVFLLVFLLVAASFNTWLFRATRFRNQLRGLVRTRYGITEPFLVQMETRPEGFWVRQLGAETLYDWAVIEGIEESSHSVDVMTRHTGMISIRKTAFASEEDMDAFINEFRGHVGERFDRPQPSDERIKSRERSRP